MDYKKYISKKYICILTKNTKPEIIEELLNLIKLSKLRINIAKLKEKIFYREKIMSTGVGLGIGIPHVRFTEIKKPLIAIGINRNGIIDYETIDNENVKIVIMILVPENQHKRHLRILSGIVSLLKNDKIREKLIKADSIEKIHNLFLDAE